MRSFRPPRAGSPGHAVGGRLLAPAALPALLRATHLSSFLGLSQRKTSEMFRVSTETIARWEMEATGANGEVVRPLVSTDTPVRRFFDVVRAVVKTMELAGFGGRARSR